MPSATAAKYTLIPGWAKQSRNNTSWPKTLIILFSFTTTALLSFLLGRYSASSAHDSTSNTADILSLRTLPQTFIYNRTFAEGTKLADHAWASLFPKQMGYFAHPQIAPHRSTFSVYHELHCLNGIRQGYWAIHGMVTEPDSGKKLNITNLPMMISPSHVRHCIDLLRQSLMCNADLTVEVKDDAAGGVHGFGTSHSCVDWSALQGWLKEWENGGLTN